MTAPIGHLGPLQGNVSFLFLWAPLWFHLKEWIIQVFPPPHPPFVDAYNKKVDVYNKKMHLIPSPTMPQPCQDLLVAFLQHSHDIGLGWMKLSTVPTCGSEWPPPQPSTLCRAVTLSEKDSLLLLFLHFPFCRQWLQWVHYLGRTSGGRKGPMFPATAIQQIPWKVEHGALLGLGTGAWLNDYSRRSNITAKDGSTMRSILLMGTRGDRDQVLQNTSWIKKKKNYHVCQADNL